MRDGDGSMNLKTVLSECSISGNKDGKIWDASDPTTAKISSSLP